MNLKIEIEKDEQFMCDRSLDRERFSRETSFIAPSWNDMIFQLASEQALYKND